MTTFIGVLFALMGTFIIFISMCWSYSICRDEDDSAWLQFFVAVFFCGMGIAHIVVSTLYFVEAVK